jgi:hypothetical protein
MEEIREQDRLEQLLRAREGYIYNEFEGGAGGALYSRLHWAGCGTLARAKVSYPKRYLASVAEAEAWLLRARGPEGVGWRRCGTCSAEAAS